MSKENNKNNKTETVTFRLHQELKAKLYYILERDEVHVSKWWRNRARLFVEAYEKENGPIKLD